VKQLDRAVAASPTYLLDVRRWLAARPEPTTTPYTPQVVLQVLAGDTVGSNLQRLRTLRQRCDQDGLLAHHPL
jgi:hypothetical protein